MASRTVKTRKTKQIVELDASPIRDLGELRGRVECARENWASFHAFMAEGLFERKLESTLVYRAGPFSLLRFSTALERRTENHIGEVIRRSDGTIEYLKTYRLSIAQTRRAFLLRALAEHQWNLEATAASLGQTRDDLVLRLERAGFGYLTKEHVLKEIRWKRR